MRKTKQVEGKMGGFVGVSLWQFVFLALPRWCCGDVDESVSRCHCLEMSGAPSDGMGARIRVLWPPLLKFLCRRHPASPMSYNC